MPCSKYHPVSPFSLGLLWYSVQPPLFSLRHRCRERCWVWVMILPPDFPIFILLSRAGCRGTFSHFVLASAPDVLPLRRVSAPCDNRRNSWRCCCRASQKRSRCQYGLPRQRLRKPQWQLTSKYHRLRACIRRNRHTALWLHRSDRVMIIVTCRPPCDCVSPLPPCMLLMTCAHRLSPGFCWFAVACVGTVGGAACV